jgi:hypothetical protein
LKTERKKMKKIVALSLAMLTFVMPVNAGWFADWQDHRFKEKKEQLWAKLQSQIVEVNKQSEIQNQAAVKLDNNPDADDLEANKEYKIETIKYWERRKQAATTAIRYNELVGDKDALEREKGYVAEAKRNIELLANENSETKEVSFSSKVSNGFHGAASFVYRHWKVIAGIACVCVAAYVVYAYGIAPARAEVPFINGYKNINDIFEEDINPAVEARDAAFYREGLDDDVYADDLGVVEDYSAPGVIAPPENRRIVNAGSGNVFSREDEDSMYDVLTGNDFDFEG